MQGEKAHSATKNSEESLLSINLRSIYGFYHIHQSLSVIRGAFLLPKFTELKNGRLPVQCKGSLSQVESNRLFLRGAKGEDQEFQIKIQPSTRQKERPFLVKRPLFLE
jgi:hypothetical protein